MAEYVNYLRVFGAPGAARALFGAIQDDTAGLGSVDLNRITPMPVWMREEPLSAGTVRRQGGENCWLDWRQANWGNAVEHAEGTGQCGGIRRRRHHPVLYAGRRVCRC